MKKDIYTQHRLLILGTQFEFTELVRQAVERGYYTVVCDGYPDGPARAYADRQYTIDVHEIEKIAQLCREERIDHILTSFSDIMFECMVKIAGSARLPCYLEEGQLKYYRSKEETKRRCAQLGIRVPAFMYVTDPENEAVRTFSYPAVIKPVDSYGSRGLRVVDSPEKASACFPEAARFSENGRCALLETLSRGQELNCMAFVLDGEVTLLSIADRMTAPLDEGHIPVNYAIRYPSVHFDAVREQVRDIFSRFAASTGQAFGPMAMQCFWDGREIEVCEIAGRLFGFEHEMVTITTGLDIEALLLDMLYEPERLKKSLKEHDPKGFRHASCVYLQNVAAGVLADQSAVERLCSFKPVRQSVLFYREGERLGVLGPKQYFARFYVAGDTREQMLRAEAEIFRHARAFTDRGEQLIFLPGTIGQKPG